MDDFCPNRDSELMAPKRHPEITKINLPATLVDLERSLNKSGSCIFSCWIQYGGVHFTLSIETKELEPIFRNPGRRDIARSAPPGDENHFFHEIVRIFILV